VVTPGFLANPEVQRWLDGIEPAWTMLDFASYVVLRQEPLPGNEAIRLVPNLTVADLAGSAVAQTARMMLQRAVDAGGLKLTATGNLSRAVIGEMIEVVEWPDFDKAQLFKFNKVINEPDFLPVHFAWLLLQETKLLRRRRDTLVPTRLGKKILAPDHYGSLQALLFHIAFWHLNLGYFDGTRSSSGRRAISEWCCGQCPRRPMTGCTRKS